MKIAIPTYNRYKDIQSQTLAFLERQNINKDDIFLFVAPEERPLYEEHCKGYFVVSGKKGLKEQRQFMASYFFEGEYICYMDDDVIDMINTNNDFNLKDFLIKAQETMKKEQCGLCGVYPVDNTFFLKEGYSTDLKFIIGAFCVVKNTYVCEQRDFLMLEDYERTLKYYLYYKKVIRFNDVIVRHKIYTNKGGLRSFYDKQQRLELKYKEQEDFVETYPTYATIRTKKNTKDLLLNKHHQIHLEKYKYDNNTLITLWIGDIKETFSISLKSWLRLGYKVILFTDKYTIDKIKSLCSQIDNGLLNTIVFKIIEKDNNKSILQYSDLFRYEVLHANGGTWIDADMVLLRRIPNVEYIISSEYTNQSGLKKSREKKIANIGLLRLPKNDYLLSETINKIKRAKDKERGISNMVAFREILKKERFNDYNKYVVEPRDYCPINWSFCKELYYEPEEKVQEIKKYDVGIDKDWRKSIGVHLWCNLTHNKYKIDFNKVAWNSIYADLKRIIN